MMTKYNPLKFYKDKLKKIMALFNDYKQLMIHEIADLVNINRNSVSKYLDILVVAGKLEGEIFGTTKVFSTH